jgi:hypothetical protein
MPRKTSSRLWLPTMALALVVCFENASLGQTPSSPASKTPADKTPAVKSTTSTKGATPAKTTAPAKAGASSNLGALEPVRKKIYENCVDDSGDFFRSEKTTKPCDCFATTMAKAMSKDDITFFQNYNVIPTLGAKKPEDVKKSCGVPSEANSPARSRGWAPKSEGN